MSGRKTVRVQEREISAYTFCASLGDIKEYIDTLIKQYGEDAVLDYSQYDVYDDGYSFMLYKTRLETDLEYETRINKEKYTAAQLEQREREQMERLMKKYGVDK